MTVLLPMEHVIPVSVLSPAEAYSRLMSFLAKLPSSCRPSYPESLEQKEEMACQLPALYDQLMVYSRTSAAYEYYSVCCQINALNAVLLDYEVKSGQVRL